MANKFKSFVIYLIGLALFLFGIILSVSYHNPHFYTPFSVGILIILIKLYYDLGGAFAFRIFSRQSLFFCFVLLVASLITDWLGLKLDYWSYPHYFSVYDEFLKIVFEFVLALMCFPIVCLVGSRVLTKAGLNKSFALAFSFIILPPLFLVFTELVNRYSDSWVYNVWPIIWYTVGAWLMVIVPVASFWLAKKAFEK